MKSSHTLLCLNTANESGGTVALFSAGKDAKTAKMLGQRALPHGKKQTETLLPAIISLLKKTRLTMERLDAIALTIGPGSFTGVRIGLATAQGLSVAHNIPLVGISTLAALNLNAIPWIRGLHKKRSLKGILKSTAVFVCPLLNARKEEIYGAIFEWQPKPAEFLTQHLAEKNAPPRDFLEEYLKPLLQEGQRKACAVLFLGEGVRYYEKEILSFMKETPWDKPCAYEVRKSGKEILPSSRAIAHLAFPQLIKGQTSDAEHLHPIYPRPIIQEFPLR